MTQELKLQIKTQLLEAIEESAATGGCIGEISSGKFYIGVMHSRTHRDGESRSIGTRGAITFGKAVKAVRAYGTSKGLMGAAIYSDKDRRLVTLIFPMDREELKRRIDELPYKPMSPQEHTLASGRLYGDVLKAIATNTLIGMSPEEAAHRVLWGEEGN